jgi:O-antigen/teichoic acid export membrane protein
LSALQNHVSGRRKTQIAMIDQAVVSGANFLTGLLLGRLLGPAGFGQFTLTYNLILLASSIQMALIAAPMQVIGPQRGNGEDVAYYRSAIQFQVIFCLLLGAVALVAIGGLSRLFPGWGLAGLALPVAIAAMVFVAQDFLRRYFFVRNDAFTALLSDAGAHGTKVVLLAALAWWGVGLTAHVAFWVMALCGLLGTAAIVLRPHWRAEMLPTDRKDLLGVASEHWNSGKWLLADSVVYWFGGQMVVIYVAGHMLSADAVGKITAAMNVVGVANILFLALENFVPSRAAHMYAKQGWGGLTQYLWRITWLGGGMTLLIVLVTAIWAEFWLKLFYGSAYAGSGVLVVWWGIYYVFGFLIRPFAYALRVLHHTRAMFFSTACGALVSATVSYPLIRSFGVAGAMMAMCMVQTVVCIAIIGFFVQARKQVV